MARNDRRPAPAAETPAGSRSAPVRREPEVLSAPAIKATVSPVAKKWALVTVVIFAAVLTIGQVSRNVRSGSPHGSHQQMAQECAAPFSEQVNRCNITEKAVIVSADRLTDAGEFWFCVVPDNVSFFHIEQTGGNRIKMWSSNGTFPIEYKMIRHENLIDGRCPTRF